ncbi:hypothetical protein N0V94_009293 [Neodidymelliopsis sp. IMI 364377]|nr:hypothetical protein N0V94_009293 [Neodidymelliopsis sp. IMI 364377]
MAPVDPSQPPAGVGGYTDAKPQFAASQPGYYNQSGQPDPYAQQGYPPQGGFSPAPQTSPAPQYESQYPHSAPSSPPLPGAESETMKYSHAGGPVEIGNDAGGVAPVVSGSPPAQFSHNSQAAELSGGDIDSHKRV